MSKLTVPNKGQIAMAEKKLFEKLDNLLYNAADVIKLAKTSSLPILEAFDDPEHLLKYRIDHVCKEEAMSYSLQQLRKEWTDIREVRFILFTRFQCNLMTRDFLLRGSYEHR